MFELSYEKNKNNELFKTSKDIVNVHSIQNYVPIYKKFFSLNEENYNSINLNEHNPIYSIVEKKGENNYIVTLKNKSVENSFFKFSPLVDPLKYMTGKYNATIRETLPKLQEPTQRNNAIDKMYDVNNSAYIDSFFYYLSSQLFHHHNFIHGIKFYGSFLCVKNDFKLNIYDDSEYLYDSTYFNNNKQKLFSVDETNEELFLKHDTRRNKKKINVAKTLTTKNLSLKSLHDVNDFMFRVEELGNNNKREDGEFSVVYEYLNQCKSCKKKENVSSSESSSQCSSTTDHSNDMDEYIEVNNDESHEESDESHEESDEEGWITGEDDSSIDGSFEDNEMLDATIYKFPVQMICLEQLKIHLTHI